ncbi:MAG: phosphate ABC transporter permease subunit PstC [Bifidobacteriaceae bacterium]|jgi:phosphate transport system permease protein|nr:phosphate ABC transporter permease subunit PstC [Bifidobacteriaceae bacterium]
MRRGGGTERAGDRVARTAATAAGATILVALAGVGLFLLARGLPAVRAGQGDLPEGASSFWQLAGPLAFGSIWAAALALVFAIPVAIGVALFITMYAPRRFAGPLGAIVDVLAAIPSVVYGLWGLMVFAPMTAGLYGWLATHAGWFPLFAGQPSATGRTILTAALVLAVMVLPIIAAVCREVFGQTPTLAVEAALALGATKWEMIRMAVFPFARSGIVSGAMLGLGRALGETMAIAMVLSPTPFLVTIRLLGNTNPNTIAAAIAQNFPEAYGMEINALIGLGLILFVITFVVNYLARRMVARGARQGA